MTGRNLRLGAAAAATMLLGIPYLARAATPPTSAGEQSQVDPAIQKAARIQAMNAQMRITQEQRDAAAKAQKAEKARLEQLKAEAAAKGVPVPKTGLRAVKANGSTLTSPALKAGGVRTSQAQLPPGVLDIGPLDVPDYFTTANWAFSPMLRKFVDTLPGLSAAGANNLGNFVPLAYPDTTTYPGSDYYEISVREYTHQFHSDMPATHVRGYVQTNKGTDAQGRNTINPEPINWLGPVIVAQKDRPVRIKFKNEKGAGGIMPIPVDETIMGAGMGALFPNGTVCDPTPVGVNLPGQSCAKYPQNRSDLHLHGGRTPWISDGTPHQWVIPKGDVDSGTNPFKQGVSLYNVPDMPVPATADETTYYWSNQQSARLMFYHDHAWGITRLNVMMGEAAGMVLTDTVEQELIADGTLPDIGIPLVIQERTFVDADIEPETGKPYVRVTDPTWNFGSGTPNAQGIRPVVHGDLWIPHVYMPAQNPYSTDGVNPFGRWVYGPWFFPPTANILFPPVPNPYHDPNCSDPDPAVFVFCTTPGQPPVIPGTPNPSVGAEYFLDTALVNGQVFPVVTVDPKTYRFRILNASNDRFLNLNIYKADPDQVAHDGRTNTEVKMVPAGQATWDQNKFPDWPADGRVEGVPDPATLGPSIVMIGTEAGFLARPVELTGQPVTWIRDPTAFNFGNVDKFNLFLGNAQRADVLIDFSKFAGQDLILYNDAPAAVPAFDPRFNYLTGAPDYSDTGGYGRVPPWATDGVKQGPQAGYGPNIRTILKIRVNSGTPGPALDVARLTARWLPSAARAGNPLGVFEKGQDPIIVGQADYNGVYTGIDFPSVWPAWGLSRIEDNTLMFKTVAGTYQTFPMEPKAMHDEMGASFDKEYGRMSTNLGIRTPIPLTNNANMTPMVYQDPTTETVVAADPTAGVTLGDGTQIWKISHNGVDTHPIHFHIFDVQLVNRVGWDGQIRLPAATELGWQDTVRVSPLEDTIVAMRPWAPKLPFQVPNSLRPLNPAIPIGSLYGFTNIDPVTQTPKVPPDTNIVTSFAWEYVWHCHILSHEENDMMRPVALVVPSVIPPAFAAAPTVAAVTVANRAANQITWVDPTPVNYATQAGFGNPAAEVGFRIERTTSASTPWASVGVARANQTTFTDTGIVSASTYYRYRVTAFNEAGSSVSPFGQIGTPPAVSPMTSVSISVSNAGLYPDVTASAWTKSLTTPTVISATWSPPIFLARGTGGSPTVYEYRFSIRLGGGSYSMVQDWSTTASWTMPINLAAGSYTVKVEARNGPNVNAVNSTKTYTVTVPAAVTGLQVSVPNPVTYGSAPTATATASGSAAAKEYQFWMDNGPGTVLTLVQPWGAANTFVAPTLFTLGVYTVRAEVRTNSTSIDRTATTTFEVVNPYATGVTLQWEPTWTSPGLAPVRFLATGQGPAPLTSATGGGYSYRFLLSTNGGNAVQVQGWSTSRVYLLNTANAANYVLTVEARTSTFQSGANVVKTTLGFTIGTPTRTVAFTTIAPANGAQCNVAGAWTGCNNSYGTAVAFTAQGAGSATGQYWYRYSLDGVVVRPWSRTASWTMPATTPGGVHIVTAAISVAATTSANTQPDGATSVNFEVNYQPVTNVAFSPIPPTSGTYGGTPLAFTAVATAATTLPAGAIQYRFLASYNGGNFNEVQAWGTASTYTMPATSTPGNYVIRVQASSANNPAISGSQRQADSAQVVFSYPVATGLVFTDRTPASPVNQGTVVTITAAGSSSIVLPATAYQYQYKVNGTIVQPWSNVATYVLAASTAPGTYVITAEVTTENQPGVGSVSQVTPISTTYVVNGTVVRLSSVTLTLTNKGTGITDTTWTKALSGGVTPIFLGTPSGGTPTNYEYQFSVRLGTGAWVVMQAWSTTATWTMPANQAAGSYTIQVEARNDPSVTPRTASRSYVVK